MVLDPIPQSLPVHFFGSRPQPPTSPYNNAENAAVARSTGACVHMCASDIYIYTREVVFIYVLSMCAYNYAENAAGI